MISSFSPDAEREVAEAAPRRSPAAARAPSRSRRARWRGSARRGRCATSGAGLGASPRARPRRGTRRARPARAGRARASGTAPRGPRVRATRAAALGDPVVQHLRRVLERLALEQPREQEVALLEAHQLLVELDVVAAGQQAPGLQLDERRRDQQELGGDVEIDPLHALDLGAERVDDARERDLPEVDLFLQDEVQEEVERAFEDRRRHLVRHAFRLSDPNHTVCRTYPVEVSHGQHRTLRPVVSRRHGTRLLGHQADRRDAARQLPRRGAALGRRPARSRARTAAATTTRSSASSTCTR